LSSIARYTAQQWGKSQRNTYLKALEQRFAWLADNPGLGKHRPEVVEGYYSFPQGRHVIFYLVGEHGIDTIGIPHMEMDIVTYFLQE